jgi:hypothetical protein
MEFRLGGILRLHLSHEIFDVIRHRTLQMMVLLWSMFLICDCGYSAN